MLEYIFHPKSVAVVGVSRNPVQQGLMLPFITCAFPGPVYPVNREGGEILGRKAYRDLKEIPGPVDYVVFGTPAASIPGLLEDCAVKGVKVASMFTAGFGESGTTAGKALQDKIRAAARRGGIRLIGPNCLGLYCPAGRISFIPDPPLEPGPVGFIAQSGGNSVYAIRAGAARGLTFSKVVSYGNGVDIDESELLEYLAGDPETRIIGAYLEGIKDGRRFREALRRAAAAKPVIVMKAGNTGAGARTSASHTGALAGEHRVWETVIRGSGAIAVGSMEEMLDMMVAFRYLPRVTGKRVGIVGWGGGASVQAADECEAEGLIVPRFPESLKAELAGYWLSAGSILDNPVDTVSWTQLPKPVIASAAKQSPGDNAEDCSVAPMESETPRNDGFTHIIRAVAAWPDIDILILHIGVIGGLMSEADMLSFLPRIIDIYIESARTSGKPTAIVLHSNATPGTAAAFFTEAKRCQAAGLPVFDSFRHAARALRRYAEFCQTP